jgi:hypothetical protein
MVKRLSMESRTSELERVGRANPFNIGDSRDPEVSGRTDA